MAKSTANYGLYKYEGNDAPDLTKLSTSMDKIDTELKKHETNIGLLGTSQKTSLINGTYSTSGTRVSGVLTLNPGIYLVVCRAGYLSEGTILLNYGSVTDYSFVLTPTMRSAVGIYKITEPTNFRLISGQATSFAITYSERSMFEAVWIG